MPVVVVDDEPGAGVMPAEPGFCAPGVCASLTAELTGAVAAPAAAPPLPAAAASVVDVMSTAAARAAELSMNRMRILLMSRSCDRVMRNQHRSTCGRSVVPQCVG